MNLNTVIVFIDKRDFKGLLYEQIASATDKNVEEVKAIWSYVKI